MTSKRRKKHKPEQIVAKLRATGMPTGWSAEITRYSRSTAWAEGNSLPGGLRRMT